MSQNVAVLCEISKTIYVRQIDRKNREKKKGAREQTSNGLLFDLVTDAANSSYISTPLNLMFELTKQAILMHFLL